MSELDDPAALRTVYREPHPAIVDKGIDHIDDGAAAFLEATTLIVVASRGPAGGDASPRGGPPGFVRRIDPGPERPTRASLATKEQQARESTGDLRRSSSPRRSRSSISFGDLAGNNRLDTYTNVTGDPEVGILAIVPGLEETLRIRGNARISTDPAIREAVAIDGRVPKAAVVVDVTECFIHCGKALRRSGVWDPASWPTKQAAPSPAEIIRGHANIDAPVEAIEADLEAGYVATLWETGGADNDGDDAGAADPTGDAGT